MTDSHFQFGGIHSRIQLLRGVFSTKFSAPAKRRNFVGSGKVKEVQHGKPTGYRPLSPRRARLGSKFPHRRCGTREFDVLEIIYFVGHGS